MSVTPGYTAEDQAAIDHALKCAQSFIDEHTHYTERDVLRCAARAALQYRARQAADATNPNMGNGLLRTGGPASREGVNAAFLAIDQAIANLPCRCTEDTTCDAHHYLSSAEDDYRTELIDAEAADTSSDDERAAIVKEWRAEYADTMWTDGQVAALLARLDAHRAARTSEPHNPWDAACAKNNFGEPTHDDARCYLCRPARTSEETGR